MSTPIVTTADITDDIVDRAVEIADGFFGERPIDWERLIDRLEEWTDTTFPDQWDDPVYGALKRRVRKARSES